MNRIQLRRARGWRLPPNTVVVSRPTAWGNPFDTAAEYHEYLFGVVRYAILRWNRDRIHERLPELRGKNLACWCRLCDRHSRGKPLGEDCPDCQPCHADVLAEALRRRLAFEE